jgi:DNA-binding Xre family transcriptional regulator
MAMVITKESISDRVKRVMRERDIAVTELARLAGIDQGNLSKMLAGKRGWSLANIERVAKVLHLDPGMLTSLLPQHECDVIVYPVVAIWHPDGFDYRLTKGDNPLDYRLLARPKAKNMVKRIYGIHLRPDDSSLLPEFPPGCVIRAQQDTWDEIKEGDKVVYCRHDGKACIRRVHFENADFILLESPNSSIPPLRVPHAHIRLMERIIGVDY